MAGVPEKPAFSGPHLVVFRTGPLPIVLLPGVLGLSLAYTQLARALPRQRGLVAFDLPGSIDDEPALPLSIADIADVLEPQLRAACPEGPSVLAGFSMGALVAFELARRLGRSGRGPDLLVSLDGFAPRFSQRPIPVIARARAHFKALAVEPRKYARERRLNWTRRALAFFDEEWRVVSRVPPEQRRTDRRLRRAIAFRHRAAMAYNCSERLDIPMLLVRTTEAEIALGAVDVDDYGWSEYVRGPVRVRKIEASHRTLLASAAGSAALCAALDSPDSRTQPVPSVRGT